MSSLPSTLLRRLFALGFIVIATACTHPLEVIGQGDIISASGERDCSMEQSPCDYVISTAYDETYYAIPRPGWQFDGWNGCTAHAGNECYMNIPANVVAQYEGETSIPLRAEFSQISNVQGDSNLPASSQGRWVPTFVDNFSGNRLFKESWVPGRLALQRRLNFYDESAVRVKNGVLKLQVKNTGEADRPYRTGAVTTQGIFKQKYGYFEIRAKVPKGNGFWPAFWLFPESGQWTSEIDVAEFLGHQTDRVHYAYHYGNRLRNENGATPTLGMDVSQSFNNYAVHWTPQRIDYLFNGQVMHSVTGAAVANANSDMFVILNLALSSQHSSFIPLVNRQTNLTQEFQVDYVRVYREAASGGYPLLPAANENIPDLRPGPYGNTALAVDRVFLPGDSDFMRAPGTVSGRFRTTAHRDNVNSIVSVFLTPMSNFNTSDGSYTKNAPIASKNYTVQLANTGDTMDIDYSFAPTISSPGVYALDIIVRDPASNNKKNLDLHRVIQYVDNNQPDTTVWFEGFFRAGVADYANGQVTGTLQLQLQQSLLSPYLNVFYKVVDADTNVILEEFSQTVPHNRVDLITLTPSLNTGALDTTNLSLGLVVDVTDSSGQYAIPTFGTHIRGSQPLPDGWTPLTGSTTPLGGTIPQQNWEPTFVDNFNGNTLKNYWVPGWGHLFRRVSYYDADALAIQNGVLNFNILNRPESDRAYTTAAITTQGTFKQQYGYFEIRARIPKGNGLWPAFWMFPESGQWTSEIDIGEFRGHLPTTVHYAFHYGNRLRNENSLTASFSSDLSQTFHTYAVYWTQDRIDFLFDGQIVHSLTDPVVVNNADSEKFMILNFALASHLSGWIPPLNNATSLASAFKVDYVRAFRSDPNGQYAGIPAPTTGVPDLYTGAYDHTAMSIDRLDNEADIRRATGTINGTLEVKSHRANLQGVVSVILTQLIDFNEQDGRFGKSAGIEAKNYTVDLASVGDTQQINYNFNTTLNAPGAYAVDIIVRDPAGNKKNLGLHRVVQFLDNAQPSSTKFFQGFIRNATASYSGGNVNIGTTLQIQQSMLAPYIRLRYEVVNRATGNVVSTHNQVVNHTFVGQMAIQRSFAVPNLGAGHNVRITVSDAGNKYIMPGQSFSLN